MNLFELIPQKNVKKLGLATGLLIIGAGALMLVTFAVTEMPYRWAVQLLAIAMLVMGIFITTRYIMKNYVYAIYEDEDGRDLTVTELSGRHRVTVCRISLSSIERLEVVEAADRPTDTQVKNDIKAQKRKLFNYCVDLFSDKYICVFSNEGGTPIAIKLTWDERLAEWLVPSTVEPTEQA